MDFSVSLNIIKHWQALCNGVIFSDIAPILIQNKIITISDHENISLQPENKAMEIFLVTLLRQNEDVLLKFAQALENNYAALAEKIKEGYNANQGRDETDATPITQTPSGEQLQSATHTQNKHVHIGCNNVTPIDTRQCLNNRIKTKSNKCERRRILKSKIKNKLLPKVPNSESVISSSTNVEPEQKNEEITNEVIEVLRKSSLMSRSWTIIAHSLGLTDQVHDIRFRVTVYNEDLSMCIVYLIKDWVEMSPKEATLSRLIQVLRSENFNAVADELTEKLYAKPVKPCSKVQ